MTESLEARIRRLEDIEAIRQLKARYCQACDDDHNPDRVAACFAQDGLWEGRNTGVHARGHDAIRQFMAGVRGSGRMRISAHMVTNPIITVTGDTAVGHWRLLMLYTGRTASGGPQYHRIIGFYDEEYARVAGQWLIQALRVTVQENGPYATEDDRLA
jgi:uncharacterized protein (TIGR02246 family)